MDDSYIDFYYFSLSEQNLMGNFKHFMGEADDAPWMPTKHTKYPKSLS